MNKVMLPYVEPMYSTYHWLANAGIPAKQNDTSDNWYYNNTVEWYCFRRFLHGFSSPDLRPSSGGIWDMPFLDKSIVNICFVRRCALDTIKTMLDDGYYVGFNGVDDYYIKGKSWYQERHFRHDGLIIGYDDGNETLMLAAYDQRMVYNVFETPQRCFVEAMTVPDDEGTYGCLYTVKAKNEPQELNLQTIHDDLKKYLSSDINDYPLDDPEAAWGIVIYDFLCIYLDKLADGSILHDRTDRRVFRLAWEHKKCMLGRIKAVEQLCGWDDKLSTAYEETVKLSDKVRFIYSKFVIKYSAKNLEIIQVILMQMKNLELDLLTDFLSKLERELDTERSDD